MLREITIMPMVRISHLQELSLSIDFFAGKYAEAKEACAQAWVVYNEAIDNKESRTSINDLFDIAAMFEGIQTAAWYEWQNAKAEYLLMMN
jgi:phosphopantetheinyl transferase (holo-ACP synthase)